MEVERLATLELDGRLDEAADIYAFILAAFGNGGAVAEGSGGLVAFTNPFDPSPIDTAAGFDAALDKALAKTTARGFPLADWRPQWTEEITV